MSRRRTEEEILADIAADVAELRALRAMGSADPLLSCRAAADYIGRSPVTISRYISQGRLRKVTAGGITGIRKSELQKILRPRPKR